MKVLKAINSISQICGYISGAGIVGLLIVMVADVVLRRFFNSPIDGATEITQLTMVFIFAGTALAAQEDGHVKIDTLMDYFPVKVQAVLDSFIYLLTFGFCMWLGWQAYGTAVQSDKLKQIYTSLQIPIYPFFWVIAACFFLAGLVVMGLLVKKVSEVTGK